MRLSTGKSRWRDHNDRLDPETDFAEIYRLVATYEFPWDFNQSLSFALFRTYAVPSIGSLLDATGQFTGACQKRYDDTGLLLEAPLVEGFASPEGRAAVRRINQMHRMYDISNDDLRYVLSTFVVVPKRWIDDVGWRPLTAGELRASVNYYRELGRHMNIADVPATYEEFEELMDSYEAEHFAFDAGARRVADATMDLLSSFYPRPAKPVLDLFSRCLMDEPLLRAFGYDDPGPAARRVARAALRARARLLQVTPPRRRPQLVRDMSRIKSYPDGYDLSRMGTFAPGLSGLSGCPGAHAGAATSPRSAAPATPPA